MNRIVSEVEVSLSQEQIANYQLSIKAASQKAVTSIVDVGRELLKIRKEVPRGQFKRLFKGPGAPFSYETASAWMRIAEHKTLSNMQHATSLPVSWYCLCLLAQIPPPRLEQLIARKKVHADLQRKEIVFLLNHERSRNRQAQRAAIRPAFQTSEPPRIEPGRLPPSEPNWAGVGDTLIDLGKLVGDIRRLRDEIRGDTQARIKFMEFADEILCIVDDEEENDEDAAQINGAGRTSGVI